MKIYIQNFIQLKIFYCTANSLSYKKLSISIRKKDTLSITSISKEKLYKETLAMSLVSRDSSVSFASFWERFLITIWTA